MFGIGTAEIILIMIIAMMVVGPERVVEFSRTAGRLLAKFRLETDSVRQEFNDALGLDEVKEAFEEVQSEVAAVKDDVSLGLGEVKAATDEVTKAADMSGVEAAPSAPAAAAFADGAMAAKVAAPVVPAVEDESAYFRDKDQSEEAEAILVEVAELVSHDEEFEPVLIDEVVLVVDDDEEEAEAVGEELAVAELVDDATEPTTLVVEE